jgi:hypothetical protein
MKNLKITKMADEKFTKNIQTALKSHPKHLKISPPITQLTDEL